MVKKNRDYYNYKASVASDVSRVISSTMLALIKYGTIFWVCYLSIKELAGKQTIADIKLMADINFDRWVAYIFGIGGIGYGITQKNLKEKNIERLSKEKEQLELFLNPDKKSSNLTSKGNTKKEDRE